MAWVLLVNLTKNAQNFRRFAPNRAGVFIFIENLQNFGRGFLIEEGVFIFNTTVVIVTEEKEDDDRIVIRVLVTGAGWRLLNQALCCSA